MLILFWSSLHENNPTLNLGDCYDLIFQERVVRLFAYVRSSYKYFLFWRASAEFYVVVGQWCEPNASFHLDGYACCFYWHSLLYSYEYD